MLNISAVESSLSYDFTVVDNVTGDTYTYQWGKQPNDGQTTTDYIQQCKNEALLLAQFEIDQKAQPTPLQI